MPVFRLPEKNIFPPPELSEDDGLLAVGGDLGRDRLLLAYSKGIFPWYSEGSPILWWSPDPRLVLFPEELKISRSLRQTIRKDIFQVTLDSAFEEVIRSCASIHKDDKGGTWITGDMMEAYIKLHHSGYAHSAEAWYKGKLAGGLYGVALGKVFFGESMFARESNASKVAFVRLVEKLASWDFKVIDCQVTTAHLSSLGAREIPRSEFMDILEATVKQPDRKGKWKL